MLAETADRNKSSLAMAERIHKMASGNLALDLGDPIDGNMFPHFEATCG